MQLPNTLKTHSILQKLQWIADPVRYMKKAAQQYPDLFTANIVGFGDNVVFVNHPQAMQEILTNERKNFTSVGELNNVLQPLLGEHSIITLGGTRHKKRRQLLMPHFHGERMRAYGHLISQLTEKVLSNLPIDQPFLARNVMQEISLQVILQVVFGLHEGDRCEKLKYLLIELLDFFSSPLTASFLFLTFLQQDLGALSPWGKFLRQRQQVDELLYAEIAERRTQKDSSRIDILSLLMSAQDENGESMTNQELCDELKALMFGGYETSATAMSWALYWIHHKPQIREKLIQELETLGNSPDPMSIFRLPYLTAVCNETLRIHPILMLTLPAVVQEPMELLGHSLEPGTIVSGCIYLIHQREDLYDQPNEFRPERFLERQFSPYEFLPFGGLRRCIGEALAMFEIKLVLAKIISSYQLTLADSKPEKPQRRSVTIAPANGVKMIITGQRIHQTSLVPMVTTLNS